MFPDAVKAYNDKIQHLKSRFPLFFRDEDLYRNVEISFDESNFYIEVDYGEGGGAVSS